MVDSLADDGPCCLLRALADSMDADRIEIAVDGTFALESTLLITRSVTVVGPEIVQGQEPRIHVDGGKKVPVLHVAKGATVTLDGLVVERGWTDDVLTGAGITNEGSVELHHCLVIRNEGLYGAGVYNTGHLAVHDSNIVDNRADRSGGGVRVGWGGHARISRGVVARNHATRSFSGRVSGSNLEVAASRIESDFTGGPGGGISGSGRIVDSVVAGNEARGLGGGIVASATPILRSAVIGNRASSGGGVHAVTPGVRAAVIIANTAVAANVAITRTGGGISVAGPVTIVTRTIAGNSAAIG